MEPYHDVIAATEVIRITAPEIALAAYRVKRKKRRSGNKSGNAQAAGSAAAARTTPGTRQNQQTSQFTRLR
ncbi:MAG: hypothetical protein OXH51_03300, partial [Gemmatimonadetes bacterium]|nr:hypothetical protein [Gemmatimonadota bacterium]